MLDPIQKQELRHAAMEYLYARPLGAFPANSVHYMMSRRRLLGFDFTADDAMQALAMLVGLGLAKQIPDPLGGEMCYQITAAGQLARERGEV